MRKQLKEVTNHISRARDVLGKVSEDMKIPKVIRGRATKIADALSVDLEELQRMREHV